jgi:predicted dienelactone hydrolase
MRPGEAVLLLADLLTLCVVAVRIPRRARWLRYAAPLALLAAVGQVLIEGPRWQLVPAYALTGLFFLIWLRPTRTGRLAVGLGVVGLALSVVPPTVLPVFQFPPPSGPYGIGTLTYHWVDEDRAEVFTADPNARRELMVQIWYPATSDPSSRRAPYVEDADALAPALARLSHVPEFTFEHFAYVTTNAVRSATVAADERSYPVLIFLEGLNGFRQMNTFEVEDLVSHGYIVAAIDQPSVAAAVKFPDGRQAAGLSKEQLNPVIQQSVSPAEVAPVLNGRSWDDGIVPYLAQDVVFTVDRLAALNLVDPNGILTGRLDLQHVGVFGVSLGGIVGGEVCRLEPRVLACLVMDAPMPADVVGAGLRRPAMWITRDAETMQLEGWAQADIDQHQATMRAVYESLPGSGYFVRVPGMFHANLTDIPYWSPLLPRLGVTGPIDGERTHSIINSYSLAFFDKHLKGNPATLLDGPATQFPEVLLDTRRELG